MADLKGFSRTVNLPVTATVPSVTWEGKITDSQTGAVLYDFTGAKAINFPAILTLLTPDDLFSLLDAIETQGIFMLARSQGVNV